MFRPLGFPVPAKTPGVYRFYPPGDAEFAVWFDNLGGGGRILTWRRAGMDKVVPCIARAVGTDDFHDKLPFIRGKRGAPFTRANAIPACGAYERGPVGPPAANPDWNARRLPGARCKADLVYVVLFACVAKRLAAP